VLAAGPTLVIETSAGGLTTVLEDVAVLFPGFGSLVEDETVAEFVKVVPFVAVEEIWTVRTKISVELAPTVAAEQVTTPEACPQVKPSGLVGTLIETNDSPVGSGSVRETLWALFGPELTMVMV